MPGSRRIASRLQGAPLPPLNAFKPKLDSGSANAEDGSGSTFSSQMAPPKHAHVPDIPVDSNLAFEALLFMYSVMCMCLQYINLYKTVWWLPHSHANYALNFYLIDPYLALFLVILMSRRFACCFVKEVYGSKSTRSFFYWIVQLLKLILVLSLGSAFLWVAYHVVLRHSLLHSLFLCYPLVTYVILFGLSLKPLFDRSLMWPCQVIEKLEKTTPKHKSKDVAKDGLIHNCSMSPEMVREEVELLKTDFNNRIKQVLFNSMLVAYYMGFIPVCFAQNTLYYDTWWVGQHVCLTWVCAFIMFMVHFLPAKYVDMLHKCALHLGRWMKVEGRHAHVPYHPWSELQVWHQGALVKHVRGLFKAEGINNSAEPGNTMHARFYFMFHKPLRVLNWLLILTVALVAYQFLGLFQATEWSHIVSLAFLLFCNYYTLFKLMRDWFILGRSYKDEQISTN